MHAIIAGIVELLHSAGYHTTEPTAIFQYTVYVDTCPSLSYSLSAERNQQYLNLVSRNGCLPKPHRYELANPTFPDNLMMDLARDLIVYNV